MSQTNRNMLLLTSGRGIQVLILLLNVRFMTHFLDSPERSNFFVMLAVVAAFGLILINPIGAYINRKLHSWSDDNFLMSNLSLFVVYVVISHLFVYPVCYIFSPWLGLGTTSIATMSFSIAAYSIATSIGNTFIPALNILNYRILFVFLTVLTELFGLLLSIAFVTQLAPTANNWLLGGALSYTLFGLIALLLLIKNNLGKVKKDSTVKNERFRGIISFAIPILMTNISLWTLAHFYKPLTVSLTSPEFFGIAGVGLLLASKLSVTFEYLLQQFYLPDFLKNINSQKLHDRELAWNKYANLALPIYISLGLFVSLFAPFIVRILAGPSMSNVIYFLALGIWAETFRASNNLFSLIGQSEMNTKKIIFPYFLGGTATIVTLYLAGRFENLEPTLPLILGAGNFLIGFMLHFSFHKNFKINISISHLFTSIAPSLIFLLVLPLYSFSENQWASIGILGFFGLLFLALQYRIIKNNV